MGRQPGIFRSPYFTAFVGWRVSGGLPCPATIATAPFLGCPALLAGRSWVWQQWCASDWLLRLILFRRLLRAPWMESRPTTTVLRRASFGVIPSALRSKSGWGPGVLRRTAA